MIDSQTHSNWLASYVPWDDREAQHLAVHRQCWEDRAIGADRPVRHLTASAFVMHPDGRHVVAHWHRKLGRWLQPGGHLEPGETPVAGCLRELAEEAGLRLEAPEGIFDLDVHRIGPSTKMAEHDHVDVRFLLGAASSELPRSPEGSELCWLTWQELAAGDPRDDGLLRVAAKIEAHAWPGSARPS